MAGFVDREDELAELERRYNSDSAELIILYGRRRLGKSELVRESLTDRENAVYYQAVESTAQNQLEHFLSAISERFPEMERFELDWETLLAELGDRDAIVVIDEFPFLIQEDSSLPSIVQRVWDLHLQDTAMTLVLIGSSISIMEEKVLSGGSPLYGRRTTALDLEPLDVHEATAFFPAYDAETAIKMWAIYGGTPYYLQTINPDESVAANVQRSILSERGLLYSEPEFLLRTELRQPNTYFSILRAIAHGRRTPNEIAGMAGVDAASLSTYLTKLQRLRLIERHIPVTASPTSSKRSRYRMAAPLFTFWFRFVYGKQDQLRLLGENAFAEVVAPELAEYVSPLFERLCQRALPTLVDRQFRQVGQWWYKEHEIDVLGLTDDGLVAGECKFTAEPVSEGVLSSLERTTEHVQWSQAPADGSPQYVLFSRAGYTKNFKAVAENRDDVQLFGPADLVAIDD